MAARAQEGPTEVQEGSEELLRLHVFLGILWTLGEDLQRERESEHNRFNLTLNAKWV